MFTCVFWNKNVVSNMHKVYCTNISKRRWTKKKYSSPDKTFNKYKHKIVIKLLWFPKASFELLACGLAFEHDRDGKEFVPHFYDEKQREKISPGLLMEHSQLALRGFGIYFFGRFQYWQKTNLVGWGWSGLVGWELLGPEAWKSHLRHSRHHTVKLNKN